jgi:hypothetical protein
MGFLMLVTLLAALFLSIAANDSEAPPRPLYTLRDGPPNESLFTSRHPYLTGLTIVSLRETQNGTEKLLAKSARRLDMHTLTLLIDDLANSHYLILGQRFTRVEVERRTVLEDVHGLVVRDEGTRIIYNDVDGYPVHRTRISLTFRYDSRDGSIFLRVT